MQSMFSAMVSHKFVGGYVAAMNGVDAIVFTAGIGENAIPVREKGCKLSWIPWSYT